MASASLEFLGFSFIVIIVFNLHRSVEWRQAILLLSSLAFLGFFIPNMRSAVPFASFLAFGYFSFRAMHNPRARRIFPILVIACVAAFVWLKKYTFLPGQLLLAFPYITIGISYIFFRVLHLMVDSRYDMLPQRISPISYLNYTLNFTTLVSGPIQRYQDFAVMQLAAEPLPLNIVVVGEAFERIIVGFFKVNVLSLFLSMAQRQALAAISVSQPFNVRVFYGTLIAALYPLYLYCNFSGYIDMVIGIARFLRLRLPENFNRPFSSDNFMNFWSRWHITLSQWLKTYVYNPLIIALMRRFPSPAIEPFLGVLAFFVTFFLVGVWHGQTSVFIFFGFLQGLGVSMAKLYQVLMIKAIGRKQYKALAANPLYNACARGFTFTWFAFTLLWFWSNWTQLEALWTIIGTPAVAIIWLAIFTAATFALALWEEVRGWMISIEWNETPVLLSRYARTVWGTALVVITLATIMLLHAPAPEIVYKAF